jgi:hypothetical protein
MVSGHANPLTICVSIDLHEVAAVRQKFAKFIRNIQSVAHHYRIEIEATWIVQVVARIVCQWGK